MKRSFPEDPPRSVQPNGERGRDAAGVVVEATPLACTRVTNWQGPSYVAFRGEERLVVSAGKVVGSGRRHNEALVTFLLRNPRAMRYGGEVRPRSVRR